MSRAWLAVAALAGVLLASGCGRSEPEPAHRADWVIRSRLQFMSPDFQEPRPPPPRESFRLWFPYVSGDLYGAPNTPAFSQPELDADLAFQIDLNEGHADLLKALEPTRFGGSWLSIVPAEARIARLSPLVLEADGIEQLGTTEWIDGEGQRLMLVYFDRPVSLTGSVQAPGHSLRFDAHAAEAGYVWIAQPPTAATSNDGSASGTERVYRSVPAPSNVTLAIALDAGRDMEAYAARGGTRDRR